MEGDWSGAAFWLVAGALGSDVAVSGLRPDSAQPDRAVADILRRMGADIREESDADVIVVSEESGGVRFVRNGGQARELKESLKAQPPQN